MSFLRISEREDHGLALLTWATRAAETALADGAGDIKDQSVGGIVDLEVDIAASEGLSDGSEEDVLTIFHEGNSHFRSAETVDGALARFLGPQNGLSLLHRSRS